MNTSKIDNDILINTFSNLDKESHNIQNLAACCPIIVI